MKTISVAVAALISTSSAIKQKSSQGPDVFGPNGTNYSNTDATYDLSRIGINIEKPGAGDNCKPGDWTTVHWTGTLPDGRVVTDSRAEPGGLPKTFALGAHEVFSCWDFAITKLKKGSTAQLNCPSYYAWGGAYTQSPLGGEPIPLNTDVNFDIEIVDCNRTPEFTEYRRQPISTTMQNDKCMWFHLEESDATSNNMVLTVQDGELVVTHKQMGDPSQKWYGYKEGPRDNLHYIYSEKVELDLQQKRDKDGKLGFNPNRNDWFFFNSEDHTLTTPIDESSQDNNSWVDNKYLSVAKEHLMPGSHVSAVMARAAEATNYHWRIEYCDVHDRDGSGDHMW